MKGILVLFGKMLYLLGMPKFGSAFSKAFNYVYSGMISNSFQQCGHNFYLQYPSYLLGMKNIKVGSNFSSFKRLRLEAYISHNGFSFNPQIIIGDSVSINFDCHIAAINSVKIGDGTLIASRVFICDHFHGDNSVKSSLLEPNKRKLSSKGAVVIGKNVWIGEGVAIMPGVEIGDNSVVGANSVVTKSFPKNSIIGGVPAKLLRQITN